MKFEIHFHDEVEHESLEECIESFQMYLIDCVQNHDVSAFQFYKLESNSNETIKRN